MGRLVINNAMTVNGAFEAPSPEEWLVLDPDSNNVSLEQFLVADAMVLGRKTYEGLAAVWPRLADELWFWVSPYDDDRPRRRDDNP
jgi:dihydrofolate reductase